MTIVFQTKNEIKFFHVIQTKFNNSYITVFITNKKQSTMACLSLNIIY